MIIKKDVVVTFHYRLTDTEDKELENSHNHDPVAYLHGHNVMVPGLEGEFAGKRANDRLSVTLTEPYGPYRTQSIQRVPIKHLTNTKKPKVGKPAVVNTADGPREVMVIKVGRFNVDVDNNHPYAGKTLIYEVEIVDVRTATADELSHGHAHGPGGHQH